MKRCVLLMTSLVFAGTMPWMAAQSPPADLHTPEQEFQRLEYRRFRAMLEADIPALGNLLSDNLVYTHATGWRQNKGEFLASVRAGDIKYHSISSDHLQVHVYGSTAVVTGNASIKANLQGQEIAVDVVYLEVFVKQDSVWRLAAWESTRRNP